MSFKSVDDLNNGNVILIKTQKGNSIIQNLAHILPIDIPDKVVLILDKILIREYIEYNCSNVHILDG